MASPVVQFRSAPGVTFDPAQRTQVDTERDEERRQKAMQRAWLYYDGNMPPQLKVKPGDYDDNVRLEYPRLIIDVALSFLFGDAVTFQVEDEAGEGQPSPMQDTLDASWGDDEDRMTLLSRLGLNGHVTGHGFLKLQPGLDEPTRLIVLDSQNVNVNWDPQDFTRVLGYEVDWVSYDATIRKNVSFQQLINAMMTEDGTIVSWHIEDRRAVGDGGYITVNEEDWPYDFAPIVDCQNLPAANEFYGQPELTDTAFDLCDRINGAATNIQKILRYHAHPKVFVYGYSGAEIDLSVDTAVNFPSSDTQVGILGMPTDLGAAFNMLDRLTDALLLLTRTPRAALGDPAAAAAAASGLALKLGFMPLVDKTSTKRNLYGKLLEEVNRRLLVLSGVEDPPKVETVWPSITPNDPMAEAQTALLQQQAGVSKATTIAAMGFEADDEMERAGEEGQAAMDAMAKSLAQGGVVGQDTQAVTNSQQGMQARSQRMMRSPPGGA